MLTLNDLAEFTWDFGHQFFLETFKGNYVWSDPDYGGDNTIRPVNMTCREWFKQQHMYGRCKGKHFIKDYCGPDVKILEE